VGSGGAKSLSGGLYIIHLNIYLFGFCLFRAAPAGYGGSRASIWVELNWRYSCQPQPQQCQIRATSVTYTTAHNNARS